MAQYYHCIAIWHDKKWRRERGKKEKRKRKEQRQRKQEKAGAFVLPNETVPGEKLELEEEAGAGSMVGRRVLQ